MFKGKILIKKLKKNSSFLFKMRSIATILLAIFISGAVSTDNRAAMSAKAVTLGVTFYTAAQIQTILQCIDPQIFAAPTDTTALITGKLSKIEQKQKNELKSFKTVGDRRVLRIFWPRHENSWSTVDFKGTTMKVNPVLNNTT